MLTVPDLLVDTFAYRLPGPPRPTPPNTRCAITGAPIAAGYPVMEVATPATNEFLGTFRGNVHGWVSESAARLARRHYGRGVGYGRQSGIIRAWNM